MENEIHKKNLLKIPLTLLNLETSYNDLKDAESKKRNG